MSKKQPPLTYNQRQLILGMLLGDGGIHYRNRYNRSEFEFYVSHGMKQQEYIKFAAELLSANVSLGRKGQKSFGPGGEYLRLSYSNKPELSKIYDLCFKSGKKTITKRWLMEIDKQAIAYWFMDDGSSSIDKTSNCIMVRFASQSFSKKEHGLLRRKLLDFEIDTTLRKVSDGTGYNIYVRQDSINKLMDLIEPFVPTQDMKYKIKRRDTK